MTGERGEEVLAEHYQSPPDAMVGTTPALKDRPSGGRKTELKRQGQVRDEHHLRQGSSAHE